MFMCNYFNVAAQIFKILQKIYWEKGLRKKLDLGRLKFIHTKISRGYLELNVVLKKRARRNL